MNDLELKKQVAITALNAMMSQNYFSICTIDNVATMLNVKPEKDAYNMLRTLHCIHYNQMTNELRVQLPSLIMRCLDVMPTPKITDINIKRKSTLWIDFWKKENMDGL